MQELPILKPSPLMYPLSLLLLLLFHPLTLYMDVNLRHKLNKILLDQKPLAISYILR